MSAPVWTPLGPGCVIHENNMTAAGRVTDIAIDPRPGHADTMYAATPSGGVWKTTDAGLHWIPITDSQETLSIGCITVDENRILAGTGEFNQSDTQAFGAGVLVSLDGGDTWERRPAGNTFDGARFCRILVHPVDPKHWFAATTRGFFETTDDGFSWMQIPVGFRNLLPISDAVMDTAHAGNPIYVAKPNEGVFRKSDSDTDFFSIRDFDTRHGRVSLALAPTETSTLYAVFEDEEANGRLNIQASDNANEDSPTWEARGLLKDQTQTDYNLTIAVSPEDPKIVFLGAVFLWRSKDGGTKWEQVPKTPKPSPVHADQHALVFHPSNKRMLWAGNDGGVFVSSGAADPGHVGDTWEHRNRGLQNLQLFAAAQHPIYESVIFGGTQDNAGVRFEGSAAWVCSGVGDAFDVLIDQNDPSIWYYGGPWRKTFDFGPMFRSNDAGGAYQGTINGLDPSDLPNTLSFKLAFDPAHPSTIYLGTTKLYVSTKHGDLWVRIKTGSGDSLADFSTGTSSDEQITSIAIAPDRLYIGTKDCRFFVLQRSADDVWTESPNAALPDRNALCPIEGIAVSPADQDKVWIVVGSKHDGSQSPSSVPTGITARLFRRDGGWDDPVAKWTPLQLPSDPNPVGGKPAPLNNPVNTIAVDAANPTNLYAGCDVGVFRSTDSGDHWQWWNENLPNVIVTSFAIHQDPRLIRAVTLGRGVWERPLETVPANDADLYLRDNALDIGRRKPTREGANPFSPSKQEKISTGAGLKVDNDSFKFLPPFTGGFNTLPSTESYKPDGNLDYIGFHDIKNVGPRHGADARIYLEVNNRGPKIATNTQARLFFAPKDEGAPFPDLPTDFWQKFPNADPTAPSAWSPMAPAQTIPALRPAEPVILTFSWSPPFFSADRIGILAVVTSPDDLVNESRLELASIVPDNKHILVQETTVGVRSTLIVLGIVAGLGLLTYLGVQAVEEL